MIDSIRAARAAAPSVGASLSGKVMSTGYSQGGHASMATQRAAERDHASEFNVAAGGPPGRALQPVGIAQAARCHCRLSVFRTLPGGKAPTDPASAAFAAYYGSYHGTYEPPFCHAQARALFDAVK